MSYLPILLLALLGLSWLDLNQSFLSSTRNKRFIVKRLKLDPDRLLSLRICVKSEKVSRSDSFSSLIEKIDSFDFQDLYYTPFLSSKGVEDLSRHLNANGRHYKTRLIGGYSQSFRRKAIVADVRKPGQVQKISYYNIDFY